MFSRHKGCALAFHVAHRCYDVMALRQKVIFGTVRQKVLFGTVRQKVLFGTLRQEVIFGTVLDVALDETPCCCSEYFHWFL